MVSIERLSVFSVSCPKPDPEYGCVVHRFGAEAAHGTSPF